MILPILLAIVVLGGLALVAGLSLGYAGQRFAVKKNPLVDKINALLPQSQCGQCGHPGCKPYAEAIHTQGEKINRCAPGGDRVMRELADLLGVEPQPLDEGLEAEPIKKVAVIDEENCIGCTKCILACPVDAIIGSNKTTHTVISDLCTGCDLCIAPCPTDCIVMQPVPLTTANWKWQLNPIDIRIIDTPSHG